MNTTAQTTTTTTATPKIELKGIKHAKFASEETECFEATVYIDGKKEGTASNDGHGGSNNYYPWSLADKLNEIAATLPDIVCDDMRDPHDQSKPFTYKPDADTIIGDILAKELEKKDLKRICSRKTLFRKAGETYREGEYSTINAKFDARVKAYIEGKYPGATILNETL